MENQISNIVLRKWFEQQNKSFVKPYLDYGYRIYCKRNSEGLWPVIEICNTKIKLKVQDPSRELLLSAYINVWILPVLDYIARNCALSETECIVMYWNVLESQCTGTFYSRKIVLWKITFILSFIIFVKPSLMSSS